MKKIYIICAALGTMLFCSCDDFLEAHYEGGSQDGDQVTATVDAIPERINSAVSGMYAKLSTPYAYYGVANDRADDLGYTSVTLSLDLNSGDMVNPVSGYDWFSVALEYSDRTPDYANPRMVQGLMYNVLYSTVEVLNAIPDDTDNAQTKAKRGQAKAIRAFSYLTLAPQYQFKYVGHEDAPCVPIMSEENDPLNNPRASLRDLYAFIIQDLTDAIDDLDGFVRENKGVIDQQVAYGLRARAYLNMEMWAEAAADAKKALEGYTPYEMSELTQPGFNNANDHSWMWALLIPTEKAGMALATWPSQIGSFSGNSYTAWGGIYRQINSLLFNKIPETDVRRAWWLDENLYSSYLEGQQWTDEVKGITYVGQEIVNATISEVKQPMPAYSNVKFGQRAGIGSSYNEGDWCMMRAEEMILIEAEATVRAGDVVAGKQILENFVKSYRNPQYVCVASSADDIVDEIWLQRRIELWGEGFAMFDKMRLEKNIVRYHPGDNSTNVPAEYQFNIAANNLWLLRRFSQTELNGNAAIEQNTGGMQPRQGDGANLTDGVTD